ncbi:uncharacterized protein SCHCODRAFT_02574292 [Schizophyllum commune H4-8]|uniref:Uncharacterized protein n=1 Tax=Schizophyllum commune (strain H4-8 / FGSC 9210) TaxID=578458 RepID=D8PNC1_SCHCM|nr:uncharacterized protein SCHCODRAFT_02574292 [Schizophyllum commune H4-8]KAI5893142.1 hypothetical protein SCHCODRAFT_02574292 [Schizophyllum commune H4-8]
MPNTIGDLAAYAIKDPTVAIVDFSLNISLAQLLEFYDYPFPKPSLVFIVTIGRTKPRLCSGNYGACRMITGQHYMPSFGRSREFDYHEHAASEKEEKRRQCLWQGCSFVVPHSIEGDEMIARSLRGHMALAHYKHTLVCPVCRIELESTQGQEFLAYDVVKEHLLTGLCVGLARSAISTGRPVTRPLLPANFLDTTM